MDFGLTDEQRDIRDTARAFVTREVVPLEEEMLRRERTGEPALRRDELRELQSRARRFGFWGMSTPEAYGGMALPAVTQSLLWTELGRTPVPFRFGGEADNILYEASDAQRAEYLLPTIEGERLGCFALTEPDAGSDVAGIRLRAWRDGGDWVLRGEKTFITFGDEADYAIVIAVSGSAAREATAFLVDRKMGWTSRPIETMGSWHTPAALTFDDVRVPASNVLGEVGGGWELAMRWIVRGRYVIPSQAVGTAERCLHMAIAHANTRVTFGRPIGERQAIQWMIADSEVELEAARWLALRCAWTVDQGQPARHPAAVAKLYGAGMVNRVVDRTLQIFGGMGYTRDLPIEGWYRAVRVLRVLEGTDEMQRMIISRDLLRGYEKIGGHLA
ncbi:acyl-CoA dehydrogenase family protein [Phytohabitans flavus]|uniref:acyl-CoA dehydrogenase family protein n=1 Tax=Phytohabitans flavus TaxID=1076124 RepID=UPI0031E8362A